MAGISNPSKSNNIALRFQPSTNYNPRYDINNFMKIEEIEYDNGYIEQRPDVLSFKIQSLLERIDSWKPYNYDGSEHLTTIVYKEYGNTTILWLVLNYNGFMHPLEIIPGTIIKLPDIRQIDDYLKEVKASTANKVVNI